MREHLLYTRLEDSPSQELSEAVDLFLLGPLVNTLNDLLTHGIFRKTRPSPERQEEPTQGLRPMEPPKSRLNASWLQQIGRTIPTQLTAGDYASRRLDELQDFLPETTQESLQREQAFRQQVQGFPKRALLKKVYARRLGDYDAQPIGATRALSPASFTRWPMETPYQPDLSLPKGVKLGIFAGYHDLERPWSYLLLDEIGRHARLDPSQVFLIQINNESGVSSGRSFAGDEEIRQGVARYGLTHVIDLHEMMRYGPDFSNRLPTERLQWEQVGYRFNRPWQILDPEVPPVLLEDFYRRAQGDPAQMHPVLRHIVNEQLVSLEMITKAFREPQNRLS
jgi:hypothetical protein